jgi:hypothetical protein
MGDDDTYDPVQWELDQLEKLDTLIEKYGWEEGSANVESRIKLIQRQSVTRQRRAAKLTPKGAPAQSNQTAFRTTLRPKPIGWEPDAKVGEANSKRCKSFSTAKDKLLADSPPPHSEDWKLDKDAPGNQKWRRFISICEDDPSTYSRVRLVKTGAV